MTRILLFLATNAAVLVLISVVFQVLGIEGILAENGVDLNLTALLIYSALIGFAGPRVIEQTVRETLPEGFQRSEFLLEHGALDMIMDRREMRERIGSILAMLTRQPSPVPA